MIVVRIADAQETFSIDRRWYTRLARFVLRAEEVTDADLSVAFVTNDAIHRLNRQFLTHDYATDVITFPLSEAGETLHGEIVLSAEYAAAESSKYGWTPEVEAALYLVHGILHLCGYDDHAAMAKRLMHARQEELLQQFLAKDPRDTTAAVAKPRTAPRKKAVSKTPRTKVKAVSKKTNRTSKRQ